MSPVELLLASLVMAAGSALQGAVGFGLALVAAPFLTLIDPLLVPGPLIGAALILTLLMAHRERHAIEYADLGWGFAGRLPGTALGALAVRLVPADEMAWPIGILVLLAVAMTASGWHLRRTRTTLLGAGALSGFMGTASSIGGPPLALVYQHSPADQLRGTLAGNFVLGAAVSLVALALVGRFGSAEGIASLALTPGLLLGYRASRWLAPLVDRGYTRIAVLCVSAAAALSLLAGRLA